MANKLFVLTFLFILPCVLTQERIKVISGKRVHLTCELNSTQVVTWHIDLGTTGSTFFKIYTCENNQTGPCTQNVNLDSRDLEVNRSNEASFLSLLPYQDLETFQCHLGNDVVKTYDILRIDPTNIIEYCNVSLPSISQSGDHQISLSCGFTVQKALDLDANITLEGLGQNNSEIHRSSVINGTPPFYDNFTNIYDAKCMINFLEIDVTRSCAYPNITQIKYFAEGNDAMFECDDALNVDWHLFDLDGREEDLANRSWIRDGGRSLLIRGISEVDVGKVVMCRATGDDNLITNGTIGFTVISETPIDSTKPSPKDLVPADIPSAHSVFFVLTLLFLTLWLITSAVVGVCLFCRQENMKSTTLGISLTSGNATAPNLNHFSNPRPSVNEGSGTRGTPLVSVTTEVRGNHDISNTNNSAQIPVSEREVDDRDDNAPNRQSHDESHLYFTLENSPSAMACLPRASTSRWHGDANPATLDESQSSHWQGYETVGESNKDTICSYDLGEYAEVGEHILGKGPPVQSVRPPIRKKPGREEVKEDDISRLYGKVNK